jgi:acetolactate synthase I/III small subunit
MNDNRHVIAALVQNEPGVLAHVAGMFAARGFNIDSLVVGRTENHEFSRMTIVLGGDDAVLEQVRKQLAKIVEVVKVVDYKDVAFVERDLMLVRVSVGPQTRAEVLQLTEMFRAQIVDVGRAELMIIITGAEDKLQAFTDLLQPYGIVEVARTGVIAMPRSEKLTGKVPLPGVRRIGPAASSSSESTSTVDPADLPPG